MSQSDAIELERFLVLLERLGAAGAELAVVARLATAAVLAVIDMTSPGEVEVSWSDMDAA